MLKSIKLFKEQQGFREKSPIGNIFAVNQIVAKRVKFILETHLASADCEKAFDKLNHGISSAKWDSKIT